MKAIQITAAGMEEIEAPADMVEKAISQQVDERLQEQHASAARQRLLKLQKTPAPPDRIVPFEVGGDTWYLLRMDFAEVTRCGLMTPRNEKGELDLSDAGALTSLTAAMLFCGCVRGIAEDGTVTDEAEFFTFPEAYEWAHNTATDVVEVVGLLFNAILDLNPLLMPDAYPRTRAGIESRQDAEGQEKKDSTEESAASESAISSTPAITTPSNGSTSTASSDEPAISPHDSESSQSTAAATNA